MANTKAGSVQPSSGIQFLSSALFGGGIFLFALALVGLFMPEPWVEGQAILGGVFGFTLVLVGLGLRYNLTDSLDVKVSGGDPSVSIEPHSKG